MLSDAVYPASPTKKKGRGWEPLPSLIGSYPLLGSLQATGLVKSRCSLEGSVNIISCLGFLLCLRLCLDLTIRI